MSAEKNIDFDDTKPNETSFVCERYVPHGCMMDVKRKYRLERIQFYHGRCLIIGGASSETRHDAAQEMIRGSQEPREPRGNGRFTWSSQDQAKEQHPARQESAPLAAPQQPAQPASAPPAAPQRQDPGRSASGPPRGRRHDRPRNESRQGEKQQRREQQPQPQQALPVNTPKILIEELCLKKRRPKRRPIKSIFAPSYPPPPVPVPVPPPPVPVPVPPTPVPDPVPRPIVPLGPVAEDVKRRLMLMSDTVQMNMSTEQICRLMPSVVGELMSVNGDAGWTVREERPVMRTLVPGFLGDMFIEAFASNQPDEWRCREGKRFTTETMLQFELPTPVPIQVITANDGRVGFGFFSYGRFSAEALEDLMSNHVLKAFCQRSMLVVRMKNIDKELAHPAKIRELADRLQVVILSSYGPTDEETQSADLTLKIMKSHWSPELDAQVRSAITQLYNSCALHYCKECKLLFNTGDGGHCIIYRHPGEQVEIEPGVWEEVDQDEETGEPIIIVKFSCCGECVEGEGCQEVDLGQHTIEKTFSDLAFSDEPIFK